MRCTSRSTGRSQRSCARGMRASKQSTGRPGVSTALLCECCTGCVRTLCKKCCGHVSCTCTGLNTMQAHRSTSGLLTIDTQRCSAVLGVPSHVTGTHLTCTPCSGLGTPLTVSTGAAGSVEPPKDAPPLVPLRRLLGRQRGPEPAAAAAAAGTEPRGAHDHGTAAPAGPTAGSAQPATQDAAPAGAAAPAAAAEPGGAADMDADAREPVRSDTAAGAREQGGSAELGSGDGAGGVGASVPASGLSGGAAAPAALQRIGEVPGECPDGASSDAVGDEVCSSLAVFNSVLHPASQSL